MAVARELSDDVEVVEYLKHPLDRPTLERLVAILDGPVTELVRRDALFAKLGLADADVQTPEQVVDVLERHPKLLQRPVVVTASRAIVGRPKSRVAELLG